jgi:PEP-CTERM motif
MNTGFNFRCAFGVSRPCGFIRSAALGLGAAMFASSAHAAFHLWVIQELFTNLDGSQQFIELFTTSSGQNPVGGQQIKVVQQGTGVTHTYTVPSGLNGAISTMNRNFLIATADVQLNGGPVPDFTLPDDFLFANGGTITFFGTGSPFTYTALPTDGITSHAMPGNVNQVNSPRNFSNQSGSVPEPSTWGALGLGGMGFFFLLRRRTA